LKQSIKKINFLNGLILKYVKPIWYHNIFIMDLNKIWIDYTRLDSKIINSIDIYNDYSTKEMTYFDAAYQLIYLGYIDQSIVKNENFFKKRNSHKFTSIMDQYIFLRRMFKPIWVYYSLFLRIISANVRFTDFLAIFKSRKVQMLKLNNFVQYDNYETYKSKLIKSSPFISIIIPTLNRYKNLESVLKDLQIQTYKNFEIIIIDQSKPFKPDFYKMFSLNIKVIFQKNRALWKARNLGIKNSSADFFLFLDDDSRLKKTWIFEHLKCIDFFKADISAGVSISKIGAPIPTNYNFFRIADQLDTGNVLIRKKVFKKCGLFDLQFEKMRMGDGEFGLRACLNGFKIIHNPLSKRTHLKVKKGGLREMGSWDGLRPKNIFNLRPIPSVLYFYRSYWGDSNSLFSMIQTIPFSLTPYSLKGRYNGYLISIVIFVIFYPLIIYQVYKSWKISDEMIKKGPIIEKY